MTNEDTGDPVTNSRTEYQGQLSRATGQTSQLNISTSGFGNALFIGNTNAESAVIRVYNYLDELQSTETVYFDYQDVIQYNLTGESKQGKIELFHLFEYLPDNFRIEVDLTTTETILYFGIVRCGFADHWTNPNYGWNSSFVDTSVINNTTSGARYVVDRPKIRTFTGDFLSLDHAEFMKWQDFFIKNQNKNTAMDFWDSTNTRQVVFGNINQVPSIAFSNPGTSSLSLELTESL